MPWFAARSPSGWFPSTAEAITSLLISRSDQPSTPDPAGNLQRVSCRRRPGRVRRKRCGSVVVRRTLTAVEFCSQQQRITRRFEGGRQRRRIHSISSPRSSVRHCTLRLHTRRCDENADSEFTHDSPWLLNVCDVYEHDRTVADAQGSVLRVADRDAYRSGRAPPRIHLLPSFAISPPAPVAIRFPLRDGSLHCRRSSTQSASGVAYNTGYPSSCWCDGHPPHSTASFDGLRHQLHRAFTSTRILRHDVGRECWRTVTPWLRWPGLVERRHAVRAPPVRAAHDAVRARSSITFHEVRRSRQGESFATPSEVQM